MHELGLHIVEERRLDRNTRLGRKRVDPEWREVVEEVSMATWVGASSSFGEQEERKQALELNFELELTSLPRAWLPKASRATDHAGGTEATSALHHQTVVHGRGRLG
jgi:hypothetical protein